MGNLTEDMRRLANEIDRSREGRETLRERLLHESEERRASVDRQVGSCGLARVALRAELREAARRDRSARAGYLKGLRASTSRMLAELSADRDGGRSAWRGRNV